jgi:hypothetical protein
MEAKSIELLQTEISSDSSLQNILKSLNNGELEVEYSIESSDKIFTPAAKFFWLAWGVIGIGTIFFSYPALKGIMYIIRLGPLNSTTRVVSCIHYLGFCHSLLEYEYKNKQLVEAKLTKLNKKTYVSIGSVPSGEYDQRGVFILQDGNGATLYLWPGSLKQEIQDVKDFCEISGVQFAVSSKKQDTILEMSDFFH